MPKIVYVGQTTDQVGKTLWEIVGNLKNYGVGRLITRGTHERYPEPSFDKIIHVKTEAIPSNVHRYRYRQVTAWVERVFRGYKQPKIVELYSSTYKPDFRLIPKDDEDIWYKRLSECTPKMNVIDPIMPLPPLLNLIFRQEKIARGEPVDDVLLIKRKKFVIDRKRLVRIAEENEIPPESRENNFGVPVSPSLYENIDACRPFFENRNTWDDWKSITDQKLEERKSS